MRTRILLRILLVAALAGGCTDDSPVTAGEQPDPETSAGPLAAGGAADCALGVEPALATTIVESLVADVEAMADARTLRGGDAGSALSHLANALRALGGGRTCPAHAQIESFRHQIENLQRRGVLRDADASPLLSRVRLLLGGEPLPGEPEEMYAPGVFGELRTVEIGGESLTYEVIDGLAVFQSDMIFGYADEFEARAAAAGATPSGGDGPQRSGVCHFHHFTCERWSDQTIGYDFADDWGSPTTNAMMRSRIMQAVAHWNNKTGIRLVPRSGGERLVFRNSTGCSSHIGRKVFTGAEPQWINLSTTCGVGAAIHEIGHAVGLYHEQSRNDRDDWVRVAMENVRPGREHNFSMYGGAGFEAGTYEYGSLMHYGCGFFRMDGAGNTLEPTRPGVDCSDLGGNGLTPTDVLGVYTLYPPDFQITGAVPGETGDRFTLEATFSTKPVRDELVFWTSDRVPLWWAQGKTASTGTAGLPQGEHLVTASIIIAGEEVLSRSIRIRIEGHAPVVDLGPDRTVDLNRPFFVSADVTDAEDGACSPTVCRYTWSPEPESGSGGAVGYRFTDEGPQTIRLTVRDGAGQTTTDEVTVTVVNSPPVPVIEMPADGDRYPAGSIIELRGHRLDINEGPGPGPDVNRCGLTWTSSDASDVIDWSFREWNRTCSGSISFGDAGTRTLRLQATDRQGLTASTEIDLTVVGCATACDPLPIVNLTRTPELDGSIYSPPFTGPGYYLDTEVYLEGEVYDGDDPPDNPIAYEWSVSRPCFGATCPPDLVLESGTLDVTGRRGRTFLPWTPSDDVPAWEGCVTTALPFVVHFRVTDSSGAAAATSRTLHLACTLF